MVFREKGVKATRTDVSMMTHTERKVGFIENTARRHRRELMMMMMCITREFRTKRAKSTGEMTEERWMMTIESVCTKTEKAESEAEKAESEAQRGKPKGTNESLRVECFFLSFCFSFSFRPRT